MRVLCLSSWVGFGHVGLGAAVPVLQALGHEVVQLPTVILSNHPGWPRVAGRRVPVEELAAMREALAANGWLAGVDAVLVGYMPSAAHVAFAEAVIGAQSGARVVVDPILGDAPKGLYIDRAAAEAIRARLVPLAHVLTPNLFELEWLAGPGGPEAAARRLGVAEVLVTSAPMGPGRTGVLAVTQAGIRRYGVERREGVPHGVGDVFAALIVAGCTVGAALGHLQALIGASLGADHLRIAEAADLWRAAGPVAEA